jgi:PTH2 family peptidyl-tRNA hydrolase
MTTNTDKKIKQVIVLRKDLHMRLGKSCAQASHASLKVILDSMINFKFFKILILLFNTPLKEWINGLFTKIVVGVDSESELLWIYCEAVAKKIPCSLIQDAGLTEFNGVPTNTCCAIGPDYEDKIDKITGSLKLL